MHGSLKAVLQRPIPESELIPIRGWSLIPDGTDRDITRSPWSEWIAGGWLDVTEGNTTDHESTYRRIQQCQHDYNLRSIGCDPANARAPGNHILNRIGIDIYWHNQTAAKYNEPIRRFSEDLTEAASATATIRC